MLKHLPMWPTRDEKGRIWLGYAPACVNSPPLSLAKRVLLRNLVFADQPGGRLRDGLANSQLVYAMPLRSLAGTATCQARAPASVAAKESAEVQTESLMS